MSSWVTALAPWGRPPLPPCRLQVDWKHSCSVGPSVYNLNVYSHRNSMPGPEPYFLGKLLWSISFSYRVLVAVERCSVSSKVLFFPVLPDIRKKSIYIYFLILCYSFRAFINHWFIIIQQRCTVLCLYSVKVKFSLERAMEAQRGSRGIAVLYL